MLTVTYFIGSEENEMTFVNNNGVCVLATGSGGECFVSESGGIVAKIRVAINKDEATRDPSIITQNLFIRVEDFFGNKYAHASISSLVLYVIASDGE